jgi:hypothetical protein
MELVVIPVALALAALAALLSSAARALLAAGAFLLWAVVLVGWSLVAWAAVAFVWPDRLALGLAAALLAVLALVWWGFATLLAAWLRRLRAGG